MRVRIVLLCALLSVFHTLKAQKAEVKQILQQVHLDSLLFSVAQLTGIEKVTINGQEQTIYSRYRSQVPNDWAATYLADRLQTYGYTPQNQYFDALGKNVYAIKEGNLYPDRAFVICAHYDAIAIPYDQAVGADDNASGCSGVLEAARLLKDSDFPFTLIFIFFDEEEQGLLGSMAFNQQFDFDNYGIEAVFNLDMIAYDYNEDFKAEIHTRPHANSVELAAKIIGLNDTFRIGLDLSIEDPGTTASDHDAFWQTGKTAVLLIEDEQDFNRFYHTKHDSMQYFNDSFLYRNVCFAIASLCWFASDKDNTLNVDVPVESTFRYYPNPSSGKIWIESPEQAAILLYSLDGKLVGNKVIEAGKTELDLSAWQSLGCVLIHVQGEQNSLRSKLLFLNP
ncbi:MAG: M20/M25/M40 family metallo-hydrolase [Bacteroidia bacterium]